MRTSDFDRIIDSEHLMLVDFYATWCGACKAMDPTLDRVALALSDIVTILRIDISSSTSRDLVRRYNIVAVPTMMLFFRGEVLWRDSGIISFDRLCQIIRRHQAVGAY